MNLEVTARTGISARTNQSLCPDLHIAPVVRPLQLYHRALSGSSKPTFTTLVWFIFILSYCGPGAISHCTLKQKWLIRSIADCIASGAKTITIWFHETFKHSSIAIQMELVWYRCAYIAGNVPLVLYIFNWVWRINVEIPNACSNTTCCRFSLR